jgi:hypothetical protein
MNVPATETPQVLFRAVDGVRIRYADSVGSRDRRCCLRVPGRRACMPSRRCRPRLPSTPACSQLTCRGSARLNAETTFSRHERWAGSSPSSLPRLISEGLISSRRTWGPRPPCSRRRHIRSESRARSWAPAEPPFRSSSASRWRRGCSTPTSQVPQDGPGRDRRRGDRHDRWRGTRRRSLGLPRLLRRRPLR